MTGVEIRIAERHDVAAIAAMLAQETLVGHGDSADPDDLPLYLAAYDLIVASPNDTLYVAVRAGEIVGTFQTNLIVALTGKGASSLTIRAVHTRSDMRGNGIGKMMMTHAIRQARDEGAAMVQLMSNADRLDAHRFYARLGFVASHVGFKMKLA